MKIYAIPLSALVCLFLGFPVKAQSSEAIWITTSTNDFKTGETVIVTVNGASATPIWGFTFQIRFDPACLQPVNAASPMPGMNGLSLPQTSGLVDASFASATPQIAKGVLAEVRFITLGACQTYLSLESAAFAIRNESGFAAPLPGVAIGEKRIALAIRANKGTSQDVPLLGTPLPLGTGLDSSNVSSLPAGNTIILAVSGVTLLIGIFILLHIQRGKKTRA